MSYKQPLWWAQLGPLCADRALRSQRTVGLLPALYTPLPSKVTPGRAGRDARVIQCLPCTRTCAPGNGQSTRLILTNTQRGPVSLSPLSRQGRRGSQKVHVLAAGTGVRGPGLTCTSSAETCPRICHAAFLHRPLSRPSCKS